MTTTKIAICKCGEPLVTTLIFPGAEMVCMGCGSAYAMIQPDMVAATPDLEIQQEWNEAKLKEIAQACIPPGSYRRDCEKCNAGEYHRAHATDAEIKASDAAYRTINQLGQTPKLTCRKPRSGWRSSAANC